MAPAGGLLVAPLLTAARTTFATGPEGDIWRLFPRLPARAFQTLPDRLLEAAGEAFGGFLATFADFPEQLETVIDGFHDLNGYLAGLDAVVAKAGAKTSAKGREPLPELRAIEALRAVSRPGSARRVIHGDCKINNLLFHATEDVAVAVIDLDTLMIGDPAWDFGDLVRSAFAGGEEAKPPGEFSRLRLESLCRGFTRRFGALDDPARYAAAPAYMSYMLAVRFLLDHLAGDVYFKVSRRADNLLRARSQLALAGRFRDVQPMLQEILETCLERPGGP